MQNQADATSNSWSFNWNSGPKVRNLSTSTFKDWQHDLINSVFLERPSIMKIISSLSWKGVLHHITSDLHNLSLHQPYNGGDEVLLGDGSGLAITHTGSTTLPLPSNFLHLDTILCVPNINKNLISVYRLCNTNKVSAEEFHVFPSEESQHRNSITPRTNQGWVTRVANIPYPSRYLLCLTNSKNYTSILAFKIWSSLFIDSSICCFKFFITSLFLLSKILVLQWLFYQ